MNHPPTGIPGLLGVALARILAALDQLPLLTDALIGAGAGVLVGKLLVRRLERRHGELPRPARSPGRTQVDRRRDRLRTAHLRPDRGLS